MGRELRRVPLDFDWPLDKPWEGFINPLHVAEKCVACDGSGYSPDGKRLKDMWYGYVPFSPEDRGSTPLTPNHPGVDAFARRNVTNSPDYYGSGEAAVLREARRLCALWNKQWSHHLNADDVSALVKADRLYDFTHIWAPKTGWRPKVPSHLPTPKEVNDWSIGGMGHDSINQWVCVTAECERLGVSPTCAECNGEAEIWPSADAKQAYEDWQKTPPPKGEGYQIWETVSEGSPISPVFSTPEDLARHMAKTKWGADQGTPYDVWLKFIRGPGWAPSMVMANGQLLNGVDAVAAI